MDQPGTMILVVEDNEGVRETLAEILRQRGYGVMTSADGEEAIERLRSGPRPSLILLDLLMPRVDGWEFRQMQVNEAGLAAIPVIAVTADARVEREPERFTAHLRKPFRLNDLITLMDQHLPAPGDHRAA